MSETKFRTIEPKILYFGTPVALISSLNEDGETNLAPISSFWTLGWTILLGLLAECPVHMEAVVRAVHKLGGARVEQLGGGVAAEVEVVRVHVESDLVIKDRYIDAAKWSPLIYNFRHYYRLADTELGRTFRAEA